MKNYKIRFRAVDKYNFLHVKNGRKSIETRAGSKRYNAISAGDKLTVVCGKEQVTKTVKKVHHFKTIAALLKALPLKNIMPDVKSVAEARTRWNSYPGYKNKIKKAGIIAWELK